MHSRTGRMIGQAYYGPATAADTVLNSVLNIFFQSKENYNKYDKKRFLNTLSTLALDKM